MSVQPIPHEIVITRTPAEGELTAELIRARGLWPVLAPLLTVRHHPLRAPARIDAVLATSGNALPALAELTGVRLLAVGDATAARARACGFRDVVSAGGDAEDLVVLTRRIMPPAARLLLATGRGLGGPVTQSLRAAGYPLHRRVVYSTTAVRRLPEPALRSLSGGRARAVIFLSAAAAETFVRVFPPALAGSLASVDALAIGRHTADILTPLPWGRVRVSLHPNLEQVLALL